MNPEELISQYLDGTLDEAGAVELKLWLKASPQNMKRFTAAVLFEQQVCAEVQARADERAARVFVASDRGARAVSVSRWFHWRQLAAATAGLVIGAFSASMVYGFVAQRQTKTETLLMEGFEDSDMRPLRLVPNRTGVWGGNLLSPREAEAGVKPAEGRRMVKLPWVERRKLSYAFRFLDMAVLPQLGAAETRRIEVTALFQAAAPSTRDRFQIRLAAFAEEAVDARELWVNDYVDEMALMHVAKTAKTTADGRGWTTVRSVIDVPASARVVLVALAAGVLDTEIPKTGYYLDDVQVRVISHDAPLP